MSEQKYVVRGRDCEGAIYMTGVGSYAHFASGVPVETFADLETAAVARWNLSTCEGCSGARIFAVAADGTETPLPTYAEALAHLDIIRGSVGAALAYRQNKGGQQAGIPHLAGASLGALLELQRMLP